VGRGPLHVEQVQALDVLGTGTTGGVHNHAALGQGGRVGAMEVISSKVWQLQRTRRSSAVGVCACMTKKQ
jgi:hypothetical protein